jgi:hypothetical protein
MDAERTPRPDPLDAMVIFLGCVVPGPGKRHVRR